MRKKFSAKTAIFDVLGIYLLKGQVKKVFNQLRNRSIIMHQAPKKRGFSSLTFELRNIRYIIYHGVDLILHSKADFEKKIQI